MKFITKIFLYLSVLIEKDHAPIWKPATVEQVTDDKVNHYFSRLPEGREWHVDNPLKL